MSRNGQQTRVARVHDGPMCSNDTSAHPSNQHHGRNGPDPAYKCVSGPCHTTTPAFVTCALGLTAVKIQTSLARLWDRGLDMASPRKWPQRAPFSSWESGTRHSSGEDAKSRQPSQGMLTGSANDLVAGIAQLFLVPVRCSLHGVCGVLFSTYSAKQHVLFRGLFSGEGEGKVLYRCRLIVLPCQTIFVFTFLLTSPLELRPARAG